MKTRREDLERAIKALRKGRVVAVPTDTVYGLIADANNEKAVRKIFDLKGRSPDKPLVLFVSSVEDAEKYAFFNEKAKKLVKKWWPGPLTLVLKARGEAPRTLVTKRGTIGVRYPKEEYVNQILQEFEGPLASTSANPSGFPPFERRSQVEEMWKDEVVAIGETSGGIRPSTVVDITGEKVRVLRKGPIPILGLEKLLEEHVILSPPLKLNVLFVCTGNTCRSPMAEWILKGQLRGELRNRVMVKSAGTGAYDGVSMTEEAFEVLREIGIKTFPHKSKSLDESILNWADWILCMEEKHLKRIEEMGHGEKAELLGGEEMGEIPDPIGFSLNYYRRVRDIIKVSIEKRVIPLLRKRLEL